MPTYNQIEEHDRVKSALGLDQNDISKHAQVATTFTGELVGTMTINAEGEYVLIPEETSQD